MRIAMRIVYDALIICAFGLVLGNPIKADSDSSDVVVIDKQTAPIRSIGLPKLEGKLDHLALDTDNNRLYLTATTANKLMLLDLKLGRMVAEITALPHPQGIAVAVNGDHFVVANDGAGNIRAYDRKEGKQVIGVDLGTDADNVRYDAAAKRFWVGYGDGALACLDPVKFTPTITVPLKAHPESFQLETTGAKRIFVNVPVSGHVAVIDPEKRQVTTTWKLEGAAGNFPMALDEEHHRMFIGCRKPNRMLVLDMETGKTLASMNCPPGCDDLHYDATAKQIYITGDDYYTVIRQKDADTYELVKNVQTGPGARTSALDPEKGWLYIAFPHKGGQRSEVRVYDVRAK